MYGCGPWHVVRGTEDTFKNMPLRLREGSCFWGQVIVNLTAQRCRGQIDKKGCQQAVAQVDDEEQRSQEECLQHGIQMELNLHS